MGTNKTEKMPVLFLGHGNPMNAIEENEFVKGFRKISNEIPKPVSILCISAHWETRGIRVTAMDHPRTIHDFGGFPRALFEVQYPAQGNPQLAATIRSIENDLIQPDFQWGLDHGAWSVIKHLYPQADVPVVQFSLNTQLTSRGHYDFAKKLDELRNQGVLIIGSGNPVHNLGMVAWDKIDEVGFAYDWAMEANEKMNDLILKDDHNSLVDYLSNGSAFRLAIPTPEHYLPMLYVLALKRREEQVEIFNDKLIAGSLSMKSLLIR